MKRILQIATALLFVLMICIPPRADEFDPPPFRRAAVHNGEFGDLVEADCRSCHGSTVDRHHRLYGSLIPDPTDVPYGNPGELYGCSSCHAQDASSGGGGFIVERDCRACHGGSNEAPIADPNGPYTGVTGVAVLFDGTGSSDSDGTIVAYDWDFGDGNTAAGATPSHTYAAAGNYTVTLTVTDDGGLSDSWTTTATIDEQNANEPPLADPNGPYTGDVGVAVLFDGTGSTDSDGTIVAYDWDFGDGNTASGATPSHTYAAAGSYTVTLTVTDDGGLSDSWTTVATIEEQSGNQPPVADAGGPYTGTPGQEVLFDGSGSFDPDGTIFAYLWDFGDGGKGVGESPTHTYSSVGTYTVTLTVGDDAGELATDTTTVEITNDTPPPPTGDTWTLRVPSDTSPGEIEFQMEIEDFGGVLWFDEAYSGGQFAFGIGQESGDYIFWMDSLGALFYGTVDHRAGTMMGIVFDFMGDPADDTILFAEKQSP